MTATVANFAGTEIPLLMRRSRRARRISLKIDARLDAAVLVLPPSVSETEGLRFAESHRDWLLAQWSGLAPRVPFADGAVVPLRGESHRIRHHAGPGRNRRGVVIAEDGLLMVHGQHEHLSRRLTDWLKSEARADIAPLTTAKAQLVGRPVGRITVRDQKTRWGSCAANGNLSFSWRLVLAPPFVLDYVVAHEVAHLDQHNHSPAFWRIVEQLTGHSKPARTWLRTHGAELHRYG